MLVHGADGFQSAAASRAATQTSARQARTQQDNGPGAALEAEAAVEPGSRPEPRRAEEPNAASAPEDKRGQQDLQDQQLLRELQTLRARDREVRAHEQAHSIVGGRYAGATSFSYQRGPDGRLYAVGGEVSIDVSPVPGNPEATLAKAEQVRRAALAPADPSAADRRIAASARQLAAEARREIAEQAIEERRARIEEQNQRGEDSLADEPRALGSRVDLSV